MVPDTGSMWQTQDRTWRRLRIDAMPLGQDDFILLCSQLVTVTLWVLKKVAAVIPMMTLC